MKPLIVYYSHTGNNESLAFQLKDEIGCRVLKLNENKKRKKISIMLDFMFNRNANLSRYQLDRNEHDLLILVAPVWGGRIASPIRAFIEKERNNIHKYFFITLCNGVDGQKEKLTAELSSIIQEEPLGVVELWINRLLPEDQRNKINHTFNYKVSTDDLNRFEKEIEAFIGTIRPELIC